MRLHRFYINEKVGSQTELTFTSAELLNQVRNVFRLEKGDKISIFDGPGFDFECEIVSLDKKSLQLKVLKSEASRYIPKKRICLFAAIVKKDTFEWIVEKATELGVTDIIPVIAERSEKKSLNEKRLGKIAIEASEQSGRGDVPTIGQIITLEQACSAMSDLVQTKIAFHTEGEILPRSDLDKNESVQIFIGPEGGWSPEEIAMFHANHIDIRCLGEQVLRSETAVIAALSKLVFY